MHYLHDLEVQVNEVRRQQLDTIARERAELIDELEVESFGFRRRLASALITLGVKIDPEAVEAAATAPRAA